MSVLLQDLQEKGDGTIKKELEIINKKIDWSEIALLQCHSWEIEKYQGLLTSWLKYKAELMKKNDELH